MNSPEEARRRRARRLFLVVLGLLLFESLFLVADRRLPLGHETLTRYGLQYTFMNGAAQDGTIPLWLPYATQGTPSAWAWFEQGTFLQQALLPAAPLFRGAGFLPLFHLGMLLEELLLLVGVWLLASKHFRSETVVFFVSVAAVASGLWMDHAALNLILCSALPLALYLLHDVMEGGSFPKKVLLGGLLAVQALGKPPLFALLIPTATLLYAVGLAWLTRSPLPRDAKEHPRAGRDWLPVAASAAFLLVLLGCGGFAGTGSLVHRQAEGRWSAGALLAGAGFDNPAQYLDFALGISPNLDATCFSGTLTLGFALLALFQQGPRSSLRLLAFLAGALLLLSASTLATAALLPIPFPARVPAEGAPILRLFLVFLAGYGFQGMLEDRSASAPAAGRTAGLLLCLALFQAGLLGLSLINPAPLEAVGRLLTFHCPPQVALPIGLGSKVFLEQAGMASLMAGLAAVLLLLWSSGSRSVPLALGLTLLVHPLDAFGWRFRMDWLKSARLGPAGVDAQRLSGLAYAPRRVPDHERERRFQALQSKPMILPGLDRSEYGASSWLDESYWFADLPESRSPALYWSGSVDRLRAAVSAAPEAAGARPPSPWNSTGAARLAGLADDKIRFFSRSHAGSPEAIASLLGRREFSGNLLLIEGTPEEAMPRPDLDERLPLRFDVTGFTSNSITLTVDTGVGGAWMCYADAWHPSWTAMVNGRPEPVLRANLAYKAIRLQGGRNTVDLRFRSPIRTGVSAVLGILSAAAILLLLRAVGRLASGARP